MQATRWFPAFIGGVQVETAEWIPVTNPSTGQQVALAARCGPAEVEAAVAAARSAFEDTWRWTAPARRASTCRAVAEAIREAADELAALEVLDTGKPLGQARTDVRVAARYFEFYGSTVEALFGQTLPSGPDALLYTVPEPYGVSAHIIPWNYPLQVAARTIAPALAAGNTCVLKPSEDAPLSSVRLAQVMHEAGLPPGTLNVIPGLGDCGAALAGHPGLDHLSFTGSRATGQSVMQAAAANIVPVTLELGGKSPHLVFPDADLDAAVDGILGSIIEHAGQNCSAGSRLIVHDLVHDEVVARLRHGFESLRIGPGDEDPDLGPLISARQRDRVLAYIDIGRGEGKLITGGTVPDEPALTGGFYVRPAIFDEVPPGATIAQEEIFGPVLCVHRFTQPVAAAAIANDTSYGLSAGIWTRDIGLAQALCRELRAGQVFINNYSAAGGVELPFGGYRRSGIGREKGFEALREYTRTKAVAIKSPTRLG